MWSTFQYNMANAIDRLKIISVIIFVFAQYTKADTKVVCYYDSKSHLRTGKYTKLIVTT